MANLSIASILVGAVLGLYFRVLILVPVIGLAWAVVVAAGIASGESFLQVAIAIAAVAISVELGYLGGTVVRLIFDVARAKRTLRAASVA